MGLKDIIFPYDINKIPNDKLKEICTDMNLEKSGTSRDLTNRIWSNFGNLNPTALNKIKSYVFSGRTAITWFDLSAGASLKGAQEAIIKNCSFNPFEEVIIPHKESLTSEPVLIGAAKAEDENSYYLRFISKKNVITDFYSGDQIIQQETVTVYINEEMGIIEIRTDHKKAKKVAAAIAQLIGQQVALEQTNILVPFASKVEEIADALDGIFIDTVGKPEIPPDDFKEEQAKAIVSVLSALDDYFKDRDIQNLEERLNHDDLNDNFLSMPFTSLLLAGLETVGLGSVRELRGLPLYDYLTPYLQKQNGSVIFNVNEDGVKQEFSIKVGINTMNITFNTPATETAIKYVRDRLIINQALGV